MKIPADRPAVREHALAPGLPPAPLCLTLFIAPAIPAQLPLGRKNRAICRDATSAIAFCDGT